MVTTKFILMSVGYVALAIGFLTLYATHKNWTDLISSKQNGTKLAMLVFIGALLCFAISVIIE